jgi:predicted transcriptional regulator
MGKTMESWTIKVPRRLSARVAQMAKKRHVSRSTLVREALEALTEGGSGQTFVERVREHIGSADDLPADILTNPKHMKGYGR